MFSAYFRGGAAGQRMHANVWHIALIGSSTHPSVGLLDTSQRCKESRGKARQGKKIKAMTYLAHHGRLNVNVGYLRIRVILGSGVLEVVF
jgi:hypothetical protein